MKTSVELEAGQVAYLDKIVRKRIRELEKKIEAAEQRRSAGDHIQHGTLDEHYTELKSLKEVRYPLETARQVFVGRINASLGLDSAGVEFEGPRFDLEDSPYYSVVSRLGVVEHKPTWCVLDQVGGGYIAFTTDEESGERIVAALMAREARTEVPS